MRQSTGLTVRLTVNSLAGAGPGRAGCVGRAKRNSSEPEAILHQCPWSSGLSIDGVGRTEVPGRPGAKALQADASGRLRFALEDPLEHPFYWWPRSLVSYPISFSEPVHADRLRLMRVDTGEEVGLQLSEIEQDSRGVRAARVHFFTDLPSGGRRDFVLSSDAVAGSVRRTVQERQEGRTIVLDSGVLRVRIPASQEVRGAVPGPIQQIARGERWVGESSLQITGDRVQRITSRRVEDGPLFVAWEIAYEMAGGSVYKATVQCEAGCEFVRFREDMEGMKPGVRGVMTSTWTGFAGTHRQGPNHPFPLSDQVRPYDEYAWEKLDAPWTYEPEVLAPGELPFHLGVYERAPGNFRTETWSNFWDERSGDALAVFIDDVDQWQDHEYAYEVESKLLEVRYYVRDGRFFWNWPLARGSRSTCIAFYDHAKDKDAMHQMEAAFEKVTKDGLTYHVPLAYSSHALFLQNR